MTGPTPEKLNFFRINRRQLMIATASSIALTAASGLAMAQMPAENPLLAKFLHLSRLVTGYDDLNPVTAGRILDALIADSGDNTAALGKLAELASAAGNAKTVQDQAKQAGLGDLLTAIVSAWYTGTVNGTQTATVVAYRDALMYRPTDDGLVVPTYCNKGPMWWQDTLPPGVSRMPINNPKVL